MDRQLQRVLTLDNAWLGGESRVRWAERHLPPDFVPRRLTLSSDERVTLVVGPRQSGKSTLIWKQLVASPRDTLYLQCEEPSVRTWLRSPALFLAELEEWLGEVPDLFFEEVQRLDDAGLFLKGLADRKIGRRIYATGSSAFDLAAATRESLAGRASRHLLLPLAFGEIAATFEGSKPAKAARGEQLIERMALYGGYPAVYAATDPASELAGLVEALVVRDASDRFRLRHLAAFRRLLELGASQVGNLVNVSEWAALTGISKDTVAEYTRLLEEAHILRLVRPFVGGKRSEITSARKVFFLDNGVRNQLFGGFSRFVDRPDRGAVFENLVFTELAKITNPLLDTLSYWQSKGEAEVDFVVGRQGRLFGCEVKAGNTRGLVSRSARSFIAAYRPALFLIVNRENPPPVQIEDTTVRFVTLPELAPVASEFLAG